MRLALSTSLSSFTKSGVPFVGPLDGYATGLGGAYSVARRVLSSYTGTLIRVRRDSDGTEADIGFTAAGLLDVDALSSFVGIGSGFVVTIYDQSGLGRDVTCASLSNQFRIVDNVVIEVIGSNGRPCAYSTIDQAGPYTSAPFTANSNSTLTFASSFYFGSSAGWSNNRYLSMIKDSEFDYGTNSLAAYLKQGTSAALYSIHDFANYCVVSAALDNVVSISNRLTGTDMVMNLGVNESVVAHSGTPIGFNQIVIAGNTATTPYSGLGDRHMEHVVWQTDIGATAAAAIRAEQEAFYA